MGIAEQLQRQQALHGIGTIATIARLQDLQNSQTSDFRPGKDKWLRTKEYWQ